MLPLTITLTPQIVSTRFSTWISLPLAAGIVLSTSLRPTRMLAIVLH